MKKHIFAVLACLVLAVSAQAQNPLYYLWSLDTLTNTGSDTIYLSSAGTHATALDIQSVYAGRWTVKRTNISGTTNIALKVESTPVRTGTTTLWASVATGAGTGATLEALTVNPMLDRRYRIILTGTGTQSTSYQVAFSGKKMVK
jgi:hypothetical protein